MKNTVKVFSITMILLALASTAFAKEKDKLDKWLDKYETFVEKVEKAVEAAKDYAKLTVAELKAECEKAGIEITSAMKKADLINALKK